MSEETIQTIAETVVNSEALTDAVEIVAEQAIFHAEVIVSSPAFMSLLLVGLLTVVYTTQPWTIRDWYRSGFVDPIRAATIEFVLMLLDVFMAISFIYYLWTFRFPVSETDQQWFVSLNALWIAVEIIKYFISMLFWRHYNSFGALVFSAILGFVLLVTVAVLGILYAVHTSIVSAVFCLVATVGYFFAFIFMCMVIYKVYNGMIPHNVLRPRSSEMLRGGGIQQKGVVTQGQGQGQGQAQVQGNPGTVSNVYGGGTNMQKPVYTQYRQ
jgi:hypothetical protein